MTREGEAPEDGRTPVGRPQGPVRWVLQCPVHRVRVELDLVTLQDGHVALDACSLEPGKTCDQDCLRAFGRPRSDDDPTPDPGPVR